jgi:PAS domain S-box-containing protein
VAPAGEENGPFTSHHSLRPTPTTTIDDHETRLLVKILHAAKVTVWAADNAENGYAIRLWNPTAERIYGFTREEAMGSSYLNLFVNPMERSMAMDDHERIIHGGKEFSWDFATHDIAKDGTIRTVLANAFRIWDDTNNRFIVAEIGIDLTDFDRSSEQLGQVSGLSLLQRDARSQLAILRGLKIINDVIATLTRPDSTGVEDVVRAISKAVHIMLPERHRAPISRVWLADCGETARLAMGSDELRVSPKIREIDLVKQVLQQRAQADICPDSGEPPLINTEGDDAYYSVVATPLLFGAEVLGVLLTYFHDKCDQITERDRILLEQFSNHAAAAVSMARLAGELQQRRQEEAERVRHAIIQSVLHTVGNEAGRAKLAVDFLTQDLEDGGLRDKSREALSQIKSAADRCGQIMTELMRLGGQVTQRVQLQLDEAVRMVTRVAERDHYLTIDIIHDIDSTLTVCASEYLFREALDNLIRNAIQAMSDADGGGDLRISARRIDHVLHGQNRAEIHLDVEDSGPGILPAYREQVWEYGFTTRGEGHGYGLCYTRGLVTMLGGSVELLDHPSELGGAYFRIILPISSGPE